jgi:hypothetical protein
LVSTRGGMRTSTHAIAGRSIAVSHGWFMP